MLKLDKRCVVIFTILLFILIGGVSAADDNSTADAVASVSDDAVAVEPAVSDAVNLTDQSADDADLKTVEIVENDADESVSKNGELLGAPAQRDVLGESTLNSITFTNNLFEFKDDYKVTTTDGITIGSDTTAHTYIVDGKGKYITGGNSCRAFNVKAATTVTFKNIRFINCKSTNGGGAVYVNRAYRAGSLLGYDNCGIANFENCTFENCMASNSQGGAIFYNSDKDYPLHTNYNVYFKNCKFINNQAIGSGTGNNHKGGQGGAIYTQTQIAFNNLTIKNCTFENNVATAGGGAVLIFNQITASHIINNTFNSNKVVNFTDFSRVYGGALYLDNVVNSEITGNFINNSAGIGGAICAETIQNSNITCNFINNTATNSTNNYGGAIDLKVTGSTTANFKYCNFTGNKANTGGAVYIPGINVLNVLNCNFTGNNATANGGGLYVCPGSDTTSGVTISDSIFYKNRVTGNSGTGGGICFMGTGSNKNYNNINIIRCDFTENNASTGGGVQFYANDGQTQKYVNVKIESSNFTSNVATGDGEYGGSAICFNPSKNIDIIKCNFNKNVVTPNGAIFLHHCEDINFDQCNFTNNNASQSAAAIYYRTVDNAKNSTINKCIFENNTALGISGSGDTNDGGAIFLRGNNIIITGNTFKNNTIIGRYGGAIANSANEPISISKMENNKYIDNSAVRGGALYFPSASVAFKNEFFDGNNASTYGGAVAINSASGTVTMTKCNFTNNNAVTDAGALRITGSDDTIDACRFENNSAGERAGAIYSLDAGATIKNTKFINNTAPIGGAIVLESNSQKINNCTFTNNTADDKGGAIYINEGVTGTTLTDDTFIGNHANNGGAVYKDGTSATLTINNNTFKKNIAVYNGGAVYYPIGDYVYRDYNYFNNRSNYNSGTGRVTWNYGGSNLVYTSKFEDNRDYAISLTKYVSGLQVTLTLTVPRLRDGSNPKVNITTVSLDGNVSNYYYTSGLDIRHDGDVDKIYVTLEQNLSTYNVTFGFEDDDYRYKEANDTYELQDLNTGAFERLQKYINDQIERGATEISLNDPSYTYSPDYDSGYAPIIINASYPITINGNDCTIDAKGYGSIFVILSDDVTIKNIKFENGNATGPHVNTTSNPYGNGGAIVWTGANGEIDNCKFVSNNATSGGAIYALDSATGLTIKNSEFESNTANDGGAIYSNVAVNVTNSIFKENSATNGGAVYANSTDISITESEFNENNAENGAAVYLDNANGFEISNSNFTLNTATNGGAVYWNASSGNIDDCEFKQNSATNGAGVYVASGDADAVIENSRFDSNTATNGGAVYIDSSDNFEVKNSNFTNNDAAQGSDVYADSGKITNINSTGAHGSSVYVDGNVTIDGADISSFTQHAIIFNNGNSTLSNSKFDGDNAVLIQENANVTLSNTNITGAGDYAVYNNGILFLSGNNFTNVIKNNGNITSKTYTIVYGNDTYVYDSGSDVTLNFTIQDDSKNTICPVSDVKFLINGTAELDATYSDKYYYYQYDSLPQGNYKINVTGPGLSGLNDNEMKYSIIKSKANTTLVVSVVEQIKQGEKVVINATFSPATPTGNVTFTVNGVDRQPIEIKNGIATLILEDLSVGYYAVTATYDGDDTHYGCSNDTSFNVELFNTELIIDAPDIVVGQNATITVTTNATGSITIFVNGKSKSVPINDGKAQLNVTDLGEGNYTVFAFYSQFSCYASQSNETNFTVHKVDVSVDEVKSGENATITITIPKDITSGLHVYVNETDYTDRVVYNNGGTATVITDKMDVGTYVVNVTYTGDKYKYFELNGTEFTVAPTGNYKINVTASPSEVPYGDNTTVTIRAPGDIAKVNMTIDGGTPVVVDLVGGVKEFNMSGLAAGDHKITVSYAGDSKYAYNENSTALKVNQKTPALDIRFSDNVLPGGKATIYVDVAPNATGYAVITVVHNGNTNQYFVDVTDGVASKEIDVDSGDYNVTAKYLGDKNYTAADSALKTLTVPRYDSIVTVEGVSVGDDNSVNVTVRVNHDDAEGSVNITLPDGTNKTAYVVNGVAVVELGVLAQNSTNYTLPVTYSGDKQYSNNSTTTNFAVGKLNNAFVDIDVVPGEYNKTTEITVTVPSDAGGNVTIYVDDVKVDNVKDLGNGVYAVNVTSGVGNHTVRANLTNSSVYNSVEGTKNYTVNRTGDYTVELDVTPRPFGDNTTITVTVPEELANNVTVKIDGVEYPVTSVSGGNVTVNASNLTAGKHTVTVSAENNNYTVKTNSTEFTVPKQNAAMDIDSTVRDPGENVTVSVFVGKNATGTVSIRIVDPSGAEKVYDVPVDADGYAIMNYTNAQPGTHNVTAKYYGDDNYNASDVVGPKNFTVGTFNSTVEVIGVAYGKDNSVNVTVRVNHDDAAGTVDITLPNGVNKTADVVNGVAVVQLGVLAQNSTNYTLPVVYSGDKRYSGNSTVTNFAVGKLNNATINITVTPRSYGENATIKVTVPADAKGESLKIIVDGVEIPSDNVTSLPGGVYVVNVTGKAGVHNVTAKLVDDPVYNNAENKTNFTIGLNDTYTIGLGVTPRPFGENTTVTVSVPAELKNNVTVTIDGVKYPVTFDDNGVGILNVSNLTAGKHTVVVSTGNANYTVKTADETFTVPKQNATMTIDSTVRAPGENVTVSVFVGKNATGNVAITVVDPTGAEKVYDVPVDADGYAIMNYTNAQPGTHNVTAKYYGDDNYNASDVVGPKNFTVGTFNSTVEVIGVAYGKDNSVNVTVKVNHDDAAGTVNITLPNGVNKTADVVNGVAVVQLGVLAQNSTNYTLPVVYSGDKKYSGNNTATNFAVGKLNNATITVTVKEGEYGKNTTITIEVDKDISGTITAYVDGYDPVVVPMTNGVGSFNITPNAGVHEVNVTLTNDPKYNDAYNNGTKFTVNKTDDYSVNITVTPRPYLENTTIEIEVPAELAGNVTVTIDDVPYTVVFNSTTGVGVLNVSNLTAGDHKVVVSTGNDNYTVKTNSSRFTIPKQEADMTIDSTVRAPGENVTVSVFVGKNATGNVAVTVVDPTGGVKVFDVPVDADGYAIMNYTNAQPGTHNVTAKYYGDDNYNASAAVGPENFTVGTFNSTVEVVNVTYGKDNSVNVTVKVNHADAEGTVEITLPDGTVKSADVVNGVAVVQLGVLAQNSTNYTLPVVYYGDKRYSGNNTVTNFAVGKLNNATITVTVKEGEYGKNTTITIEVDKDISGTITAYVDGYDSVVVPMTNGVGSFNITPNAGVHEVNVTLTNNPKYNDACNNGTKFTVNKTDDYSVNITVTPRPYLENTTIEIEVPAELAGNVTVTIDDVPYTVVFNSTTGVGVLNVSNLTAGDHKVVVSTGNDNYTVKTNSSRFTIPKQNVTVDITTSGNVPGKNVTVSVFVAEDAEGNVAITIDGVTTVVPVDENGYAIMNYTNAQPGTHNVTAQFLGDDNYNKSAVSDVEQFHVDKFDITIADIDVVPGNNGSAVVTVTFNETDTHGNVTVKAGDQEYTVAVVNGKATVEFTTLGYNESVRFNVTYGDDWKFNDAEDFTEVFFPLLTNATVTIDVTERPFGENTTIKVTVPSDAKEESVVIVIDDVVVPADKIVPLGNGVYVVNITGIAGVHNVTAKLVNDPKYNDTVNETLFTIPSTDDYSINITVTPRPYLENTTVEIEVPGELADNVTVTIDGVPYTVTFNDEGVGILNVSNLTAGKHTVAVSTGNNNYTAHTNSSDFTVPKQAADMSIVTDGHVPGENVTVTVHVGDNATGKVAITVDDVVTVVDVDADGYARLNVTDAQPGIHNVTAEYYGDDNYNASAVTPVEQFHVDKFDITIVDIEVVPGNNGSAVVTVTFNETDTHGNVTVKAGDQEYTVPVENGKATVEFTTLGYNESVRFNVTYGDDWKFNDVEDFTEVFFPLLTNATVTIDVTERPFGENTTIKVTVPSDAKEESVVIIIDGVEVSDVTSLGGGVYVVNTTGIAGVHNVTAKLVNDPKYNDTVNKTQFTIPSTDDYSINVTVVPAVYGENTTITIEVPSELKDDVNVTIDGKPYTVTFNDEGVGVLNVSGIPAGDHEVVVTAGNNNYTAKTNSSGFTIDKATPALDIEVTGSTAGAVTTIEVKVAENATGFVVVVLDGAEHTVPVGADGIAVYEYKDAQPGNHTVNATYLGDNNYTMAYAPDEIFEINKFPIVISIEVAEIPANNNVTVIIKSGTTDANGTVTVTVGDKPDKVTADMVNGVAVVNLGYIGANMTQFISAQYSGNSRYEGNITTKEFDLPLLENATVEISVEEALHGDDTRITVTVPSGPKGTDGTVVVKIDGEEVPSENITYLGNGVYEVNVKPTVGPHTVYAELVNDSIYASRNATEDFTVNATDKYDIEIEVTPAPFGDNTTIEIKVPSELKDNTTVMIDGVAYDVDFDDNGIGILNVSTLPAGTHEVTVTTDDVENYTAKVNSTKFDIPKQTPSMEITTEGNTPGENVTVTVNVGKNATGKVLITVDGIPHSVPVTDGVATYVVEDAQPGVHDVTAEYFGDKNYNASDIAQATFEVDKFEVEIEVIKPVNATPNNEITVTVKVDKDDANGTVTIKYDGGEASAEVVNGIAHVDIGMWGANLTVPLEVNYTGNAKYNGKVINDEITTPLLDNATVRIELDVTLHGQETTITVKVPAEANGNVTLEIDGVPYNLTKIAPGVYQLNTTPDVGNHSVVAKLVNDSHYGNKENDTDFEIELNETYEINVDVTPAPYGDNTTIEIRVPADLKDNVTVTIDGVPYTVTFNDEGVGVLNVSNLTAGDHVVNVTAGNDDYATKENVTPFTVPRQTPEMDITTVGTAPGENVTVSVFVGDNATGRVAITVVSPDGSKAVEIVDVDEDGYAVMNVTNAQPGTYNVSAEYFGDDNYNASASGVENFTVERFDAEIKDITVELNDDNSAVVTVTINETDASGNVTVKVGDQDVTVPVENGVAVVDLTALGYNEDVTINVTYSGDDKYNGDVASKVQELPLLTNGTVDVKVTPAPYGENTTVEIKVPADAGGNVTLYVNGTPITVTVDENGTAVINVTPDVGPNEIKVTLTDSPKYADMDNVTDIVIAPYGDYDVEVTVTPAPFGENTTVEIKVPADLKDDVTVTIDGVPYTVEIDENGNGILNVDNLTAGDHIVTVTAGNENFTTKENVTEFSVPKQTPEMDINVEGTVPGENVTITVAVGDNATGFVTITVDGVEHTVPVEDGVATWVVEDAQPGIHNVTAKFLGDDNYNASDIVGPEQFPVDRFNASIENITVELKPDNSAVVTITINETDAAGNVTVKVGDQDVTVPVENGVAVVNLTALGYNEDVTLNVTYSGDGKYNGDEANKVESLPALTNGTVEVKVTPAQHGENTTVEIKVPADAGGNVTLYVNGTPITVTVDENGTAVINVTPDVGPNEIKVTLTDSPKYADMDNVTDIVIAPYGDYDVEVTVTPAPYGENTTVEIKVPADLKDDVTVTIDGVPYTVEIDENGNGILNVDNLTAGDHVITVTAGNENFTTKENVTEFTVPKQTPEMDISVEGTVPGENVTVTVTVGDNATGFVTITVDGVEHTVPVEDGVATWVVEDAQPGVHNVTAKFLGDDNYNASDVVGPEEFPVDKFNASIENITVELKPDNSAVVTITINETDAAGNVTVKVGEQEVTVPVENGKATVNLTALGYNEDVTLNVTYSGDNKYNGDEANKVESLPALTNGTVEVKVTPAQHGENTTVEIKVPADAGGNVTLYVNGTPITVTVDENGTAIVNVTPDVGPNEIKVTLTDSPKYADMENVTDIVIAPYGDYDVEVTVTPAPFGENTTVEIKVPADLKDDVTVTIDGIPYPVEIDDNGNGILNVDNLTAGDHVITVTAGNENYTTKENVTRFNVPKQTPEMDISVEGTVPGENVIITVTVGDNATGKAVINVDGTDHVVDVIDGVATYVVEDAQPGKHNVTAQYLGDDNYNASAVAGPEEFPVDKFNASIENITVELKPDNSAVVTITINETDAAGNVTVKVGEQVVTVPVENGVATVDLTSLGYNEDVTLNVTYSGDNKYNGDVASKVESLPALTNGTVEVKVTPAQHGENTTVEIKVPADAGGNVTLYVNGTPITVAVDENGTAIVNVTPDVGPNEIKVTLTDSPKYADMDNVTDIVIESNDNYDVEVTVTPAPFGENTTVEIKVPSELKDNVTVTIDGVPYTVEIDDNGTAILNVDNLTAGPHEIIVSTGNENYTAKENATKFNVPKQAPEMNISVEGTTPGEDVIITVTVGDNATGKAVINVDGTDHVVDVIDGVATYVVEDAQPGVHNVTAQYLGDDNYNASAVAGPEEFPVDRFNASIEDITVELKPDNSAVVTITINETDAAGNVTVKVGEQVVTVPVENGKATVDLTALGYDENVTLNVTYSGDAKYNGDEASKEQELSLLTNATVEVEVTPAKHGDNTTVTIKVPADANGTVTLYVNGTPITVEVDENGTATVNVTPDVGPNEIKVTLTDSPKYADMDNVTDIVIESNDNYDIEVTVTPAPFGENTTVEIKVPADLKDDVTVTIDGVPYTVEIDDNGTGIISIDTLPAGPHEVIVKAGNENYTPKENVTKFSVPKETPDMGMTVEGTTPGEDVTITVTVGDNATGDVVITVDGVDHIVPVEDGVATYVVEDAQPGVHNVTSRFLGDDNYNKSGVVGPESFEVNKFDAAIDDISVELNPDNSAVVTVTINESDAAGNVTVKVGEQEVTVPVENGVATVDLASLGYDENATIEVTYSGDDRYNGDKASKVEELPLLTNATVDVEVVPAPFGENTSVTVTVPADANGTVTVYVNGTPIEVTPDENGKAVINVTPGVGPNEIRVTLTNSSKYADTEETETVDIAPNDSYDVDVEVTPGQYGENTTVKVTVPAELADTAKVTIDGVDYPVKFDENGTAIISVADLPAGDHEIRVTTGDENYTAKENVTKFTVDKAVPEETAEVEPIDVGEVAQVVVTLPEDATGAVIIEVNGTKYVGEVVNGVATVNIPNLPAGTHDLNVLYTGDDNYDSVSEVKPVTVSKVDDENATASASDVEVGSDVPVTVTLPEDATGTVTVKIGDVTRTVPVTGGENEILVPGVPVGEYDVEVTYNGDDKYEAKDIDGGKLSVAPKKTSPDDMSVADDGNGTLDVSLPKDATGEVDVTINNDTFQAPLVDGKAQIDLSNLTPGTHEVTVTYRGDENHTEVSYNTTITIPKYDAPLSIDVDDSMVGDVVKVVVGLPEDATGKVTVEINGKNFTADAKDGKAEFDIEGLMAGNKTVIASYDGDDWYVANSTTTEFKVVKHVPDVSVNVKDTTTAENPVVEVTVPQDATGYVIVEIDGVEYGINITAGEKSAVIPVLKDGKYDVKATYLGDDKYLSNANTTKFTVIKADANMNVSVENATKDGADVKVTLPDDATGTLTVTVDGKDYVVPAKGGENIIPVSDLGYGDHNVTVSYTGDGKYANDTKNTTADVPKPEAIGTVIVVDSRFTRVATDYNAGERGGMFYGILMDTNGNRLANKEVQVAVNGPIYTVITDEDGRIGLQINLAQANVYTYALFFQGDEKYNATLIASSKLTVTKKPTSISASDVTFKATAKVKTVKVTLKTSKNPYDGKTYIKAGKWISLKVEGKTYKARINSQGIAKFNVKITTKGKFTAKIRFAGDKTYESSSAKIKITVN